jgi:hypothetical protein
VLANDARCTREIESTIVMAKAAFSKKKKKKKTLSTKRLDLNLR